MPPWKPAAYLEVSADADADGGMRAGEIPLALGRGEVAAKVEKLRVKLKRLTERGWPAEDELGIFTLVEGVRHHLTRQGSGAGIGSSPRGWSAAVFPLPAWSAPAELESGDALTHAEAIARWCRAWGRAGEARGRREQDQASTREFWS